MASNRHLGRIVALQTLYEYDFRGGNAAPYSLDSIYKRNIEQFSDEIDDKDFVINLITGVDDHTQELDSILAPLAPEWPLDQISQIDKIILRIALYELHHRPKTPPKVVINEAVELAKSFGGDNSSKFVNGVLGTALKNVKDEHESKESRRPSKEKKK